MLHNIILIILLRISIYPCEKVNVLITRWFVAPSQLVADEMHPLALLCVSVFVSLVIIREPINGFS
jgi:hypothetical protein